MNNLADNLLSKYKQDNLAQVYLGKYPSNTNPVLWAKSFIKEITPIADHPDILWVERVEENTYKVESPGIIALNKFLNYRPINLKKKFIFINDAHLMSTIVSNKLLKVFEELPLNSCLFLFAPQDQELLPTVESRAIKILLPKDLGNDPHVLNNAATLPSYHSAQELMTALKKSDDDHLEEKRFIEQSLTKTLESQNFQACNEALETLKHYGSSAAFNNAKLSRLALFFK